MTFMLYVTVALGGFATGIVVGVVLREALEMIAPEEREVSKHPLHRSVRWIISNIMLIALFIVVIMQGIVGILLMVTKNELSQTVQCQASYNQQFSEAYRARTSSFLQARDKLNDVLFVAFDAIGDVETGDQMTEADRRLQEALNEYISAERQYQEERQINPFPPLPNTYCDRF